MKIILGESKKEIKKPFNLTGTAEKIRIKRREEVNAYGHLFPVAQEKIKSDDYLEWMIGYDVKWGSAKTGRKLSSPKELKKLQDTTLENIQFDGANGFRKSFYELSEYVYYFYKWGVIKKETLIEIKENLEKISDGDLISNRNEMQINRDPFAEEELNGVKFNKTNVKYPLLVYGMKHDDVVAEIKIAENQHAVGIQPMFYLCLPIDKVSTKTSLIGRTVKSKEIGEIIINEDNIDIYLTCLRLFGILSPSHKHDVLEILDTILSE